MPTDTESRAWINTDFADRWRLNDEDSLLPYGPGETVADFTIRPHPTERAKLTQTAIEAAEETCRDAAVPESQMAICTHDVALTGDARFAEGLIDFDRADVVWSLGDQSTLVSDIKAAISTRTSDPDVVSETPTAVEAPSDWKDEIWAIYDADAFQSDWKDTFVASCEANPNRTEASCACAFDQITADVNSAPEDVKSRVAYMLTREEVNSNSNALDALRSFIRRTNATGNAADENRAIIADYRLYLSVKDQCAHLDQGE